MSKKPPVDDPHAAREAATYENPIPSREFIQELLRKDDGPLNRNQLARALNLQDHEEVEALRRRLRAMERDGQLIRNRRGAYGLPERMDLIKGRVQAHRDGFGFVLPEDGSDDLYLSAREMDLVFDGDEVLVRVSGHDSRGRREGAIVDVLERRTHKIVGRYQVDSGVAYVMPDSTRIHHDIIIPQGESAGAKLGQYVVAEIVSQPERRHHPVGRVAEVLGDAMAPGMEIDVAIHNYDIPNEFPPEVVAEAKGFGALPAEEDKQHRVDLRELPLVTIDGEDARDFDDAVYCEHKRGGGWRLWVAIADVSHYVAVGSALDREAQLRGNSVYFPGRVVPMLPEQLSNGLCSLNPDVDRLCMVCEMTISESGKLSGYRFYEAVMHSHARLTYTEVGAILDPQHARHSTAKKRRKALVPMLEQLHALYKVLRLARSKRGAIDFETTETRMEFSPERKIERIVPVVRNDAHKLIEECMLCANVATAKFLEKAPVDALYRVHQGPKEQKLSNLREFLGELGLNLGGGEKPTPTEYQTLLSSIAERPDAHIIQTMMLRSLSQAVYQPDNEGHFGLHYAAYTHFTSPIRRYPDLLVHRAIRYLIRSQSGGGVASALRSLASAVGRGDKVVRVKGAKKLPKAKIYPYELPQLVGFGEQCSMTERRADDATRDVTAWLKCEYLSDRVGEEFEGVVSAVTGFGLFVELSELYVEGLVHISALDRDYYHFDAARQRLVGERSGGSFQLGDELRVRVARVDLDDRKIDFELVRQMSRADRRARNEGKSPSERKPSNRKTASANKKLSLKSSKNSDNKSAGKTASQKRKESKGRTVRKNKSSKSRNSNKSKR